MSMRNDANDDFDDVPSLRADPHDVDDFPTAAAAREHSGVHARSASRGKVKVPSTGPLWALVGALLFAFAGLAWWSFQQISLMEQQLVATQESFARISEEAAGRLQDISGKVVASQSNVTSDSEALKLKIKQLETGWWSRTNSSKAWLARRRTWTAAGTDRCAKRRATCGQCSVADRSESPEL